MPYGYIGQNTPNQTVSNSGVFSISDVASLEKQGKFGGSLELIAESNPSSDSFVDFTSIQQNKYDVHLMQFNVTASALVLLKIQFYESGVLETGLVYDHANQFGSSTGVFNDTRRQTGTDYIEINYNANGKSQGYIYFYNLGNSSKYSFTTTQGFSDDQTSPRYQITFGGGVLKQASEVDGIRIFPQDIASYTFTGNIKLYGVKQL